MCIFADKVGVSKSYLSRVIKSDKTYTYILLDYLSVCDARVSVAINDKYNFDNTKISGLSTDEIAKQMGSICRAKIIFRYGNVAKFALATNKNKSDIYPILSAKNKSSIDNLFDLFEELKYKVEFTYELI